MKKLMGKRQDQQSRVFDELSALLFNIIRSPPPSINLFDGLTEVRPSSRRSLQQITPAGFASLMLGISVAMMFCGSVTFFIGFIMMPWVLGLAMVFYFVGIVFTLSMLGRALLCQFTPPPSPPPKDVPGGVSLWEDD